MFSTMGSSFKKLQDGKEKTFPYQLRKAGIIDSIIYRDHENPGASQHLQWAGQRRGLETWGGWCVDLGEGLMEEIKSQGSKSKQRCQQLPHSHWKLEFPWGWLQQYISSSGIQTGH